MTSLSTAPPSASHFGPDRLRSCCSTSTARSPTPRPASSPASVMRSLRRAAGTDRRDARRSHRPADDRHVPLAWASTKTSHQRAIAAYFERYDGVAGGRRTRLRRHREACSSPTATPRHPARRRDVEVRAVRDPHPRALRPRRTTSSSSAAPATTAVRRAKVGRHRAHPARPRHRPITDGGTADVLMVGDRDHDVHGAAHWGIPPSSSSWGYGIPAENADARTDGRHGRRPREAARAVPDAPLHVTFVCTGNICRSPMAEKIFAAHIQRGSLDDQVRVTSAGTDGWHVGDAADDRAPRNLAGTATRRPHRGAGRARSISTPTSSSPSTPATTGSWRTRVSRPIGAGCCAASTRSRTDPMSPTPTTASPTDSTIRARTDRGRGARTARLGAQHTLPRRSPLPRYRGIVRRLRFLLRPSWVILAVLVGGVRIPVLHRAGAMAARQEHPHRAPQRPHRRRRSTPTRYRRPTCSDRPAPTRTPSGAAWSRPVPMCRTRRCWSGCARSRAPRPSRCLPLSGSTVIVEKEQPAARS